MDKLFNIEWDDCVGYSIYDKIQAALYAHNNAISDITYRAQSEADNVLKDVSADTSYVENFLR